MFSGGLGIFPERLSPPLEARDGDAATSLNEKQRLLCFIKNRSFFHNLNVSFLLCLFFNNVFLFIGSTTFGDFY